MDNRLIIYVEVENKAGVLNKLSSLFSRRGFNIESLSVGYTREEGISRFTITFFGEDIMLEQIRKQAQKLIHVLKVQKLTRENSVLLEFIILKLVYTKQTKDTVDSLCDKYQGKQIVEKEETTIISFSGNKEEIQNLLNDMPQSYILDMTRTGKVGMKKE